MLNNEQFFANYKNTIEQMLASNPAAPESVKKLVELNLQTAESAVEDASKLAQAMTGAKNPQEIMDLQTSMLKSVSERTMSYSQKLVEIVSSTAADVNLGKFAQGFAGNGQQPFMAAFDCGSSEPQDAHEPV